MVTVFKKIVSLLALLFVNASAAVNIEDIEADLNSLGISPDTTVWTTARLRKLRPGETTKFPQTLRTFTKIKVLGADIWYEFNCTYCSRIVVRAELGTDEVVDLDFGYVEHWRSGKDGTFGPYLTKKDPAKTYSKWGKRVVDAISSGEVFIGMTASQAQMSWGFPSDRRTTQTQAGTHEQWIYGNPLYGASYMYLDNGKVTAVQQ